MHPIAIRPALPDDLPFIFSTFIKSFKHDGLNVVGIQNFYGEYQPIVDNILKESTVSVAALCDQQDVILGYCVSDTNILHYLFVKEAFRDLGIASQLLKHSGPFTHTTHLTEAGLPISKKHKLVYNPFLLYRR